MVVSLGQLCTQLPLVPLPILMPLFDVQVAALNLKQIREGRTL